MNILINKKKLSDIVRIVSRFSERGTMTAPILSSILFVVSDEGIKLRATNLETAIDYKIDSEKKNNGVVAIPARILEQISSSFIGDGMVSLEQNGDSILIKSGNTKSTIKTVPYEDFPIIPIPESPKGRIVIPGVILKSLLSSIAPCASVSTIRPELASIYLSIEGGVLTAVATDSFRLVEKKVILPGKSIQNKILIPAKNALDIAQALPDEEVIMSFDDHQCVFIFEQGMLSTRLTSASYPDYRQIIPKESVTEATILVKDFEMALKRTALFADTFQKIKLSFEVKKKTVAFFAQNTDIGESNESISGQISGSDIELSFNHKYLQSFLSLSDFESITLTASGIGRPLIIRGTGDSSLLYLVSPMNQ